MKSIRFGISGLAVAVVSLAVVGGLSGQSQDWCQNDDREDRHCEVREFTLRATGALSVDAKPNGGIQVTSWSGNEIQVLAKITSRAGSEAEARDMASEITIDTNGTIEANGPRTGRKESWSVSYRIRVPANTDLRLESTNGGVSVEGVNGDMDLSTTNGGLSLNDIGGDVKAHTTNGGITVSLSGSGWDGSGLEAVTTNGGVVLTIPEGYNADLETGTRNGSLSVDFPVTVSGRISKSISAEIGNGGAPIRVRTTNGGVQVRRR